RVRAPRGAHLAALRKARARELEGARKRHHGQRRRASIVRVVALRTHEYGAGRDVGIGLGVRIGGSVVARVERGAVGELQLLEPGEDRAPAGRSEREAEHEEEQATRHQNDLPTEIPRSPGPGAISSLGSSSTEARLRRISKKRRSAPAPSAPAATTAVPTDARASRRAARASSSSSSGQLPSPPHALSRSAYLPLAAMPVAIAVIPSARPAPAAEMPETRSQGEAG